MPHRRADEGAHRRDALLGDRAGLQGPAGQRHPGRERLPDPVVRPVLDLLRRVDLHVEPAHRRRAHAVQREPVGVPGVDQLVGRRCYLGEDPQPRERVHPLPRRPQLLGDRLPADAVEAVAAGDHVALEDALHPAGVGEGDLRPGGLDVVDRRARDVEEQRPVGEPGRDEVLDHLGLPVDHHRSTGQRGEADPVPFPGHLQVDAVVDQTLPVHPIADTRRAEQVDRLLLEDAGPDPGLDVLAGAVLDDDAVDAGVGQQAREEEAGGACADDPDLGAEDVAHGARQACPDPSGEEVASAQRKRRNASTASSSPAAGSPSW